MGVTIIVYCTPSGSARCAALDATTISEDEAKEEEDDDRSDGNGTCNSDGSATITKNYEVAGRLCARCSAP